MADPQQNGRIKKVFGLTKRHFYSDMERDFRIRVIFPCRDRTAF